jgi:CheY-like chemotaxis protein
MRECIHAYQHALTSARRSAGRPAPDRPANALEAGAPEAVSDSVTLIVVEDKPLVREQTTAVLERAGYRLVPIADGQAAIDELTGRAGPVDVLVADVVMPDVSGLELAEAIIERDPRVGLVLLSRYDETTLDVAHIKSHGAVFELTPIGSPGLLEAVLSATPVKQDG